MVADPVQVPARFFSWSNDFWASDGAGGSDGLCMSDWAKTKAPTKVSAAITRKRADFIGASSSKSIWIWSEILVIAGLAKIRRPIYSVIVNYNTM